MRGPRYAICGTEMVDGTELKQAESQESKMEVGGGLIKGKTRGRKMMQDRQRSERCLGIYLRILCYLRYGRCC